MRKIGILLTLISAVILWSCNYSETKNERLNRAVSEFNDKVKTIDVINYYPETYTEIKTDSIIANTFKVEIKNFSSNKETILVESSTEYSKINRKFHRVFQSEIHIKVFDRVVYENNVKMNAFNEGNDPDFWDNATLEHVWIDQWNSNSRSLALNVSFLNPLENTYKLYEVRIDTQGNESKRLIDQNS